MTIEQLDNLFNTKLPFTANQFHELENILKKYPYSQPFRALHLKALKDQNKDALYKNAIATTAVYTNDRTALFQYLEGKNISSDDKKTKSLSNTNKKHLKETIEKSPTNHPNIDVIEKIGIISIDKALPINEVSTSQTDSDTVDKPYSKLSFDQWMTLVSNRIDFSELAKDNEQPKKESIAPPQIPHLPSNKRIKIDKNQKSSKINLAKERNIKNTELMTETLAETYLKQQKYSNAIEAYKILMIKNSEKSGYFAAKLKEIRGLKRKKS